MALTELQRPTKDQLYARLSNSASEMARIMNQWTDLANFIDKMDGPELDTIGVPSGQVRTDMVQYRTLLNEMADLYTGSSITPTNVPVDLIEKIRHI